MALASKTFSNAVTFTRASNATYFDSAGLLRTATTNAARIDYNPSTLAVRGMLIEEQRTNLITYSEDFNNSIWQLLNSPIISQNFATAPNGSTSADLISTSVSASGLYRFITTTNSTVHTMSIFLKYVSGGTTVYFGCDSGPSNAYVTADISVGTITSSGVNVTSSSITNVGNGWYRITVTFTTTTTTPTIIIYSAGPAARSFLTWGAQLEAGAFATSYIPSTVTFSGRTSNGTYFDSSGVLQTAGSGVSRTTYNPSNLTAEPFLLLEESRTNSIRNNTMVGAVAGSPGSSPTNWGITSTNPELVLSVIGTGTESGITYIDVRITGTMTASRSLDISMEVTNNIAASSGQTWTQSVYLRQVGGSQTNISAIYVQANTYTAANAYITTPWLAAQTVTTAALATQRFSAGATLSGATTAFIAPFLKVTTAASGAVDFTLRIGMPQLELGAYPTSVISTSSAAVTRAADTSTSATATRAADVCLINTLSPWFNASEGTLFAELTNITRTSTISYSRFAALVGSNSDLDEISIYTQTQGASAGRARGAITKAGTSLFDFPTSSTATDTWKAAIAYKENDSQFACSGLVTGVDTEVALPTCVQLKIFGQVRYQPMPSGWIRSIKYYPRRLTQAELITLTT